MRTPNRGEKKKKGKMKEKNKKKTKDFGYFTTKYPQ